MIGIFGEVYPISLKTFSDSYMHVSDNYDDAAQKPQANSDTYGGYVPTIKNQITGEMIDYIKLAKTCISSGDVYIYAMPAKKNTKVFSHWVKDGYMLELRSRGDDFELDVTGVKELVICAPLWQLPAAVCVLAEVTLERNPNAAHGVIPQPNRAEGSADKGFLAFDLTPLAWSHVYPRDAVTIGGITLGNALVFTGGGLEGHSNSHAQYILNEEYTFVRGRAGLINRQPGEGVEVRFKLYGQGTSPTVITVYATSGWEYFQVDVSGAEQLIIETDSGRQIALAELEFVR